MCINKKSHKPEIFWFFYKKTKTTVREIEKNMGVEKSTISGQLRGLNYRKCVDEKIAHHFGDVK